MNKKLVAIIEGALLITIGVLIAVFGGKDVMDMVFGILFIISGAAFACLSCLTMVKTKILPLGVTFAAATALFFGILLVASKDTVMDAVRYAMIATAGLGAALFLKGLHVLIAKKLAFTGVGQMVIGAGITVVSVLYLFPPEGFFKVFWIIVGVLIAVGGLYTCLMGFFGKEAK